MCIQVERWRAVQTATVLLLTVVALCAFAGAASAAASGGATVGESGAGGATTLAADGPPPVVGETPPKDPDDDGVYEDVRGDNDVNILDVQALFNHLGTNATQNNAEAFDFSPSDSANETTIIDVQALFGDLPDDSQTDSDPEFGVQSVSASYDAPNQQALVSFTVENTGDAAGTQNIDVTVSPDSAGTGQTFNDVSLAPGETFSQSDIAIDITGAGTASTSTVTTSATTVGITVSTANASGTASATVPGPDIQIVAFDVSNNQVTAGESLTAKYIVENQGGLGDTIAVEKYQDGSYAGDRRTHDLAPGEREEYGFTYDIDRSDAPSTTLSVFTPSGDNSELETVAVEIEPRFANVEINDRGSTVSCIQGPLGACRGTWEYELNFDVSYTLDGPATDELVTAEVETFNQNAADTYFDEVGVDSRTWMYSDTWQSQSQRCEIPVEVFYRVKKSNGKVTDTTQETTEINLC